MDNATQAALQNAAKLVFALRTHPVTAVADRAKDIIRRARPTAAEINALVATIQNTGLTPAQRAAALDELGLVLLNSGLVRSRG